MTEEITHAAGAAAGEAPAPAPELDEVTRDMIAALEGRAAFYDLLASIYYRPLTSEQIDSIANLDWSEYEDMNELFAEGANDVCRYLRRRHSGTRQELAVDFTSAFAGTQSWKGRYAVPYESVHTSEEGIMFQDAYHEVYRVFKENHVAKAEGYDFPHDHLSFMCEFLAVLSGRIADALAAGDDAKALEQVEVSRAFLADHILSWFDTFQGVALYLIQTRFYRGIPKISKGFFLEDAELLASIAVELEARLSPDKE
ncbi:molecular chaperone [uncultured Adlercreutzia sp.]|uniref:TorD/DmsD family molecular chaperone n=1 Tax=uncultured Adlercreutzia sp. TaxID=875803 RepID=UPI0026F3BDD8|nr:molecular chaperone TorD family protein [uncultured Adlercreutzia sp.]